MDITTARDIQAGIEAAAKELNSKIATAAEAGLVIEADIKDVRQLRSPAPVPFIDVSVKIRPSDISIGETADAS